MSKKDILVIGYNHDIIAEQVNYGNYVIVLATYVEKSKANETFVTKNTKEGLLDLLNRVDKVLV